MRLVFIDVEGVQTELEASAGRSVMEVAVEHGIAGIDAECGGSASCATCHVRVDDNWLAVVGDRNSNEDAILGFRDDISPQDHLACQIELADTMDGMIVTVVPRDW